MAFRVRKKDIERIGQLNTKAQRKKSRISRVYDIDTRVDIKPITSFETRQEFNDYVDEIESFTRRGNPKYTYRRIGSEGKAFPNSLINSFNVYGRQANLNRENELEKWRGTEFYENNQLIGVVGDLKYNKEVLDGLNQREYNLDNYGSVQSLESKVNTLKYQSRDDYFEITQNKHRENYAMALLTKFGEDAEDIAWEVLNMNQDDFNKLYYSNRVAHIGFIYEKSDVKKKLETIQEFYAQALNG